MGFLAYAYIVSFNIMIINYAKRGYSLEALELVREMVGLGVEPHEFTIVGLLVSCGQLEKCKIGEVCSCMD